VSSMDEGEQEGQMPQCGSHLDVEGARDQHDVHERSFLYPLLMSLA
jgi:hypothetical protein